MLLKIYTCQDTIKIIDGIEDAEVHEKHLKIETWMGIYNDTNAVVGGFRLSSETPDVQSFDWKARLPSEPIECASTPTHSNQIRVIDYKKSGVWNRVAIQRCAYLCNDEGRTIQKID